MKPGATLDRVSFSYPGATAPALEDETWHIRPGSISLLVGGSGSGKSTLLRCFNGLVPHFTGGRFGGTVVVNGIDTRTVPPRVLSREAGFVFQDPEVQLLTERVESDIAFGLEQAGIDRATMRRRVDWAIDATGISHLADRRPAHLSGGERQRVAIAAAIANRPSLLVLDEPASQLDPAGARQVVDLIGNLRHDTGLAVVVAEHRLEYLIGMADVLKVMGEHASTGTPRDVAARVDPTPLPGIVRLARALGIEPLPLTLDEARLAFAALVPGPFQAPPAGTAGDPLSRATGLDVDLAGRPTLRQVDLEIREGEIVALIGQNGSGKTTLLRSIAGLQPVRSGSVHTLGHDMRYTHPADLRGMVGYVPQQATVIFASDRLGDEFVAAHHRVDPAAALRRFGLDGKIDRHPLDLSGGERERAALAVVMARSPRLLLLDEPTRGMDAWRKRELAVILGDIRDAGTGVVLATHDADLAAACATRMVGLDQGRVVADGSPGSVLATMGMETQVSQIFGSEYLTVDDVLAAQQAGIRAYGSGVIGAGSAASAM